MNLLFVDVLYSSDVVHCVDVVGCICIGIGLYVVVSWCGRSHVRIDIVDRKRGIWRLDYFGAISTISMGRQSRLGVLVGLGNIVGLCVHSRCRMYPKLMLVVVVEGLK